MKNIIILLFIALLFSCDKEKSLVGSYRFVSGTGYINFTQYTFRGEVKGITYSGDYKINGNSIDLTFAPTPKELKTFVGRMTSVKSYNVTKRDLYLFTYTSEMRLPRID